MAYGSVLTDTVQSSTAATAPVFKDGNGTEVGTLCRAWVNFNGTGTVAIRGSFNVSSITDNGTGDYTVNFTNAMPDTNYSAVLGCSRDGSVVTVPGNILTVSTSSLRFELFSTAGALVDRTVITASVFR